MKILLYYLPNFHSVAIETLCSAINKTENELIVLTISPRGEFHKHLDKLGVENYSKVYTGRVTVMNYIRHFFFLLSFCRKHKIDVIWSHLNVCNMIAGYAQYFTRAKVIAFRHHFHSNIKHEGLSSVNSNERRMDKMINRNAKTIVVPSIEVRDGMINYEKVHPRKIKLIPYIYDFTQYGRPDPRVVESIRKQFPARFLLLTASRMIKLKRHDLLLPIYKRLMDEGYDFKALWLDDGEEKGKLLLRVKELGLENHVFFIGRKENIIDYLGAVDALVHPSATEASSSLVKEAGLVDKPVIACSGVGDFDQYIVHEQNGMLVRSPGEEQQFEEHIRYLYNNPDKAREMGVRLHDTVIREFSPNEKTIGQYLECI